MYHASPVRRNILEGSLVDCSPNNVPSNFDDFDDFAADARTSESRQLTKFGNKHGGSDAAYFIMMTVKFVAIIGVFVIASLVGDTNIDAYSKTEILGAWLSLAVIADLVVLFLYCKLRFALLILGGLLLILVTFSITLSIIFSSDFRWIW